MKKKILVIIVCTLLMATALQITGTATFDIEENPEIRDETSDSVTIVPITGVTTVVFGDDPEITDDVEDLFGRFAWLPSSLFGHIDIESAWFFEDAQNPDYLYTALKIKDLKHKPLRAIYSVHWEYNGQAYASGLHVHSNGKFQVFFAGTERGPIGVECDGTFNEETDIVTWEIPKSAIGNPEPGDVLTKTFAWTALRFRFELLTLLFVSGELVKDTAPFLEGIEDYGNDYIIQY